MSMEACKHFSDHIIIKFLLDLISKNAEPTLVVSVLQFLNTLTDENPLAINSISPEKVEIFANLSKNQDVQLSILSCCILWNVKSIMRPEDVPEARNMIIMTVTESLKLDLISKCAAADAAGLALDSTVDNVQVSEEALKLGDITNVENSNTVFCFDIDAD